MAQSRNNNIHVTHITPPEEGWPVASYCPTCRETTFVLSKWAVKPVSADYLVWVGFCYKDECNK